MVALSRFVLRWAALVAFIGVVMAGVGAYYSIQLYKNLRTDLEELLPSNARSVLDFDEVSRRLESVDNLAVLVFSKDTKASRRFVDDLATELKKAPKDTIASVEYRIDKELEFFKLRRALYMDTADLIRIKDYIKQRLAYERSLYNPLNIFAQANIPEPTLDFRAMRKRYDERVSAYSRFPGGYYATPDQLKRVVLVYMPGRSFGTQSLTRLKDFVTRAVAKLDPHSYAPDLEVKYTGGVQNTIEEQSALVADLELSTIIVTVLVTAAMWLFFRGFLATAALVLSLFSGTLWTFGISFFAVGYLNANSAFLGSIVIGNGINFGIIMLARYMEERRKGFKNTRAVHMAMTRTSTATATAALAAGLSYGSLMLTGFRGFRQFGIIGLIGMVLCWISAYTMLPALLTLFDRIKPIVPAHRRKPKSFIAGTVAKLVSTYPKVIWGIAFAITLTSLAMFVKPRPDLIETDLTKLRNKESMEHGSGYLSKYVDEIFQRYLTPMVILPHDENDAREIARLMKEKKESEGKSSLIAAVEDLDDFLPKDQPEKIRLLEEIKKSLPPRLMRRLSPDEVKLVHEYLNPEALKPIHLNDLPELVLSKFREKDGSIGKLVLVEPPIGNQTLDKDNLIRFITELRGVADSVEPGAPLAGTLPITADMLEAISRDGPRATLFAFLAVVLLVITLFRSPRTISLILFSLILGVLWMAGVILGFDLKINFLNFIALPITFGIGVDYGVNVFQRYRQEGRTSIATVIRDTGGAVGLCSFTTITGYSSLLIAQNQAFVSFGTLAVLGEITCLLAAVVALPAFLLIRAPRPAIDGN